MSEPHRWMVPCDDCGDETEHFVTSVLCSDCIEDRYGMPDPDELEKERVIYESELRELVEGWRSTVDSHKRPGRYGDVIEDEGAVGIEQCARELEALIEGETDNNSDPTLLEGQRVSKGKRRDRKITRDGETDE